MARWIAAAVLVTLGLTLGCLAQTTVLVEDSFDSVGPIDIFTDPTWVYVDLFGESYNLGVLPEVVADGTEHGGVLHFDSGSGRQVLGSLYYTDTFADDELLMLEFDVRRESLDAWFCFDLGYKSGPLSIGDYGVLPTMPPTTVWGLPGGGYYPGSFSYATPMYPLEGYAVQVPSGPVEATRDIYYASDIPSLLATLPIGEWHSIRLSVSKSSFAFLMDGRIMLEVPYGYYSFDQLDDWMLVLGDMGSGGGTNCDVSMDNVYLARTRLAILAIVDTFGLAYEEADALYNEYGPEALMEALAVANGDWAQFLAALSPGREARVRLQLESVTRNAGRIAMTVRNRGNAGCNAGGTLVAGLSYCTSWIPETATRFYSRRLDNLVLAPGASATLVLDLPEVPAEARTALAAQLEELWTGYVDPDPERDYIGLVLTIDGTNTLYTFLPLDE